MKYKDMTPEDEAKNRLYWQQYYQAHKETILMKNGVWNEMHPEQRRKQKQNWLARQPETYQRDAKRRSRARKKGEQPS